MLRPPLLVSLLLIPGAALAHTGIGTHGTPFVSGVMHPLLGADHLLAMLAVGLLAAMVGGRAPLAYPASFVGAMILGGFLGFEGVALPIIEPTILASVVVLGAAIAFALRPPMVLACGAIAVFGIAHGYAHGLEAPALGDAPYVAGFVVSTLALHGIGLALGFGIGALGRPGVARSLGTLGCLAGVALALS